MNDQPESKKTNWSCLNDRCGRKWRWFELVWMMVVEELSGAKKAQVLSTTKRHANRVGEWGFAKSFEFGSYAPVKDY